MSKRVERHLVIIAALILTLGAAAPLALAKHGEGEHDGHGRVAHIIIAFGRMYGVDGPFIDPANAIRGIVGDEEAWKLNRGRGFLTTDGRLRIRVRGLIFGDGSPNDEPFFRGAVSCLTEDEDAGTTPVANVVTQGFPATPEGDANIDAQVTLPNPCVAPVIFVLAGSEDKWFAVTGFESEGASTPKGPHDGGDHGENGDD